MSYSRENYLANRDEVLNRNAESSARNREKRLAYWRKRNADPAIKARRKRFKLAELPPEKAQEIRNKNRQRAQKHADKLRAYWKAYRRSHPEKTKAHNKANWHKRRALIKGATVNPRSIKLFILGTRSKRRVICYYCQGSFPGNCIHFDHIIPLSKGGPHSVENLCVSCPKCNQTKTNKPIQEWFRLGQQIMDL